MHDASLLAATTNQPRINAILLAMLAQQGSYACICDATSTSVHHSTCSVVSPYTTYHHSSHHYSFLEPTQTVFPLSAQKMGKPEHTRQPNLCLQSPPGLLPRASHTDTARPAQTCTCQHSRRAGQWLLCAFAQYDMSYWAVMYITAATM